MSVRGSLMVVVAGLVLVREGVYADSGGAVAVGLALSCVGLIALTWYPAGRPNE